MLTRFIAAAIALVLIGCGKRLHEESPPAGCFALVAMVADGSSQAELNEIEQVMQSTPGGNPYPELSFQMAKGMSGRTALRAIRKKDIKVEDARAQIQSIFNERGLASKVELILIE